MFLPSSALLSREYNELLEKYEEEKEIGSEHEEKECVTEKNKDVEEAPDKDDTKVENCEAEQEEALFDPPLYKQRYNVVTDIINSFKAKIVIDMGCSEGQFIGRIKHCPTVEKCIGIDVDRTVLESNKHRLNPLTIEYLLKREVPLTLSLYNGSISDPDVRFRGVDVIACIEVIEHLYDETLDQVPHALFGVLAPKVIIITTPNSEYNVLFKHFSGMRHWDHKFEWTRKEFESWCSNIVKEYPYNVEYSGIGDPPASSDVGHCSQMAVFTCRVKDEISNTNEYKEKIEKTDSRDSKYDLVYEVEYPYEDLEKNRSARVISETDYIINHYFSDVSDETEEVFTRSIPIDELLTYPGLKKFNLSKEQFVKEVEEKYQVSSDESNILASFKLSDFMRESWYSDGSDEFDIDGDYSSIANHAEVLSDDDEENWDI